MSGEKRNWYGSSVLRTTRCTWAVRGSMKVSESPPALATMTDFSSGVMYRWCGSLPVGMRCVTFQVPGSMTLTLASSELRTKIGAALCDHAGSDSPSRQSQNASLR